MNTKWLLILAVVVGVLVLALGFGGPTPKPVEPTSASGELIAAGHFVLERDGKTLLDESYTLFSHAIDGYMLLSQGELYVNGQTIALAQQAQYDREYKPFSYQLAADTPSGTQIISAQMGVAGLSMEVRVGLARQSADVAHVRDLALLDNNVISQYVVLLDTIRAEQLPRKFVAAIPQALLSLPASVDGPERVTFRSGDEIREGKGFDVHLGDTEILLVEYGDRLVALLNRTQETVGYDVDLLPKGFSLIEEARVEALGGSEREMAFASGELALAGTLALPQSGDRPFAAALFIHGSGPIDRDGNAQGVRTEIYRQLAHALAEAGIASLRFDKRGVGESGGDAATASRSDLLADVRAAVEALRAQPEIDGTRIFLIGHSEGAYLAPIVAVEDPTIAGVVLLAGAADSLAEITRWQVETLLRLQGAGDDQVAVALAQEDEYLAFVKTSTGAWSDYSYDQLRAAMPWLTESAAAQLTSSPLSLSWLREHYTDDPRSWLRQLRVPVLAMNGSKDLQVPSSEADAIREALEGRDGADVTAVVLDDLNHLLRRHPESPSLIYRHLDEPVDPRVVDTLIQWARARFLDD